MMYDFEATFNTTDLKAYGSVIASSKEEAEKKVYTSKGKWRDVIGREFKAEYPTYVVIHDFEDKRILAYIIK